jgi:hypothetical protein
MTKNNKFKSILFFIVIVSFFIFLPTQNTYAFLGGAVEILSELASGASNSFIGGIIGFAAIIAGLLIEFIIGFGNLILKFAIDGTGDPTGSGVVVVEEGWKIVRNLANSALIIGLVFIAINIILGKEEGTAKKTLVNFVIVALLINFTPLICGFIIKGSQIIALSFIGTGLDMDSANRMLDIMKNMQESVENPLWLIPGLLCLFVFALLYFIVCVLYSILFMVRTVILWILIIASPIALATKVFPKSDIVMKFFPSILYWDEWYKTFFQWVIIIIPAGLFLHLSNLSMQSIISSPVSYVGATGVSAIIQITFAAVVSYLTPIIILLAGFMITISSGGQVAAPIGAFANKAKGVALGVAKDGAKGLAGGYFAERKKEGSTRKDSAWKALTNFNTREEGRQHFDEKVEGWHAAVDYKKRRELASKRGDKHDEAEEDIKQGEKKIEDAMVNGKPASEIAKLQAEQTKKIQEILTKELATAEREIIMAQGRGDIEKANAIKKSMVILLAKYDETKLKAFEGKHNVKLEDIAKKMNSGELLKTNASFLKNPRVVGNLSDSAIKGVAQRGSSAQQNAIMEGAASINLDNYNKGTKEYDQARQTKVKLYASMNKSKEKDDSVIASGRNILDTKEKNNFDRLVEIQSAMAGIQNKRNAPGGLSDKDKKDYFELEKEAHSLRKEIRGIRGTQGGRHYP